MQTFSFLLNLLLPSFFWDTVILELMVYSYTIEKVIYHYMKSLLFSYLSSKLFVFTTIYLLYLLIQLRNCPSCFKAQSLSVGSETHLHSSSQGLLPWTLPFFFCRTSIICWIQLVSPAYRYSLKSLLLKQRKYLQAYLPLPQFCLQTWLLVVKNLPIIAGDMRHMFDPWVGNIPWRRA